MSGDPWKHRGAGMKCATCMWYVPKVLNPAERAATAPYVRPGARVVVGRCRRHAPTMNGYPVVYETDWCGDHKLDETKIAQAHPEMRCGAVLRTAGKGDVLCDLIDGHESRHWNQQTDASWGWH